MAKTRNHYDNLRVAQNAPTSVIKAAYKALSQTYHPDKFQGNNAEAERIMKLINTSYTVLIDPVKRAEHDIWIREKEAEANKQREKPKFSETNKATEQENYQKQEAQWKHTPPQTQSEPSKAKLGLLFFASLLIVSLSLVIIKTGKPTISSQPLTQQVQAVQYTSQATPEDTFHRAEDLYKQERYAEALPLFQKLAEQGYADAQNNLGLMYGIGNGVAQDYNQAVNWYRKAAEQGLAQAQLNLGFMYDQGKGVAQDYNQAVIWYRKAAEQGHALAQFSLGFKYVEGKGIAQDYNQAIIWYRKAAEQEDALAPSLAQNDLGNMYYNGNGVDQDYNQAINWYRKAAEQGHPLAQKNLGLMYEQGKGVAQDYNQALSWYRKAVEQGNAKAQFLLGDMYYNGNGVTQDYNQAVNWYRKAVEQGDAQAQLNLGFMYEQGKGVTQDYNQAVIWYRKAAEQDYPNAQHYLDLVQTKQQEVQENKTADKLTQETPQQLSNSEIPKNQTWVGDWGNGIIAIVSSDPCQNRELINQDYDYLMTVSIPKERLKNPDDAWRVLSNRAVTITGCWSKRDWNMIHVKLTRKKGNKTWEQDFKLDDGNWKNQNDSNSTSETVNPLDDAKETSKTVVPNDTAKQDTAEPTIKDEKTTIVEKDNDTKEENLSENILYIEKLKEKYSSKLTIYDDYSLKVISSYNIDCPPKGSNRYLPLINILYVKIASLDSKDTYMAISAESRGDEVRIYEAAFKKADGKEILPPELTAEINKWGQLRLVGLNSGHIGNACYGSSGPIWLKR